MLNTYILLDTDVIGLLNLREKSSDSPSRLLPVLFNDFKNSQNNKAKIKHLLPGWLQNNIFYPSPLKIGYIEIINFNYGDFQYLSGGYIINSSIRIFTKDFEKAREVSLEFRGYSDDYEKIINLINKFIDTGSDIDSIEFDVFKEKEIFYLLKTAPSLKDYFPLLSFINSLHIRIFVNSFDKGKWTDEWNEAEIVATKPTNSYLTKLFIDGLMHQEGFAIEDTVDGFLFSYHLTSHESKAVERKEITSDREVEKIKDRLKIYTSSKYNIQSHLFDILSGGKNGETRHSA